MGRLTATREKEREFSTDSTNSVTKSMERERVTKGDNGQIDLQMNNSFKAKGKKEK